MSMGFDFEIKGVDHLIKKLARIDKKTGKQISRKAATAGAKVLRKAARDLAPKGKTGVLKKNIKSKVKVFKSGKGAVGKVQIISDETGRNSPTDAYYGKFQEYGTAKFHAQPFLRPALENNQGAIIAAIKNKMALELVDK